VLSTLTLFGTGIVLLVSPHRGLVLGLHKASFVVWFGACSIHVLGYLLRTLRDALEHRVAGEAARLIVVCAAIGVGVIVAAATYPLASPWFHGGLGPHR
jgi:hypothetical protein